MSDSNASRGVWLRSGSVVTISGQHVYVESGVSVIAQSGLGVLISGQHVFVESGVHVVVESGTGVIATVSVGSGLFVVVGSGNYMSGMGVQVQSGYGVLVSGQLTTASGIGVTVQSGLVVQNASAVYSITSGNPLKITSASGGVMLVSKAVISVTVKALVLNSGDIYLGGQSAGDQPYSGAGFVLAAGEAINVDVDNIAKVWACAAISGDRVTYLGIA